MNPLVRAFGTVLRLVGISSPEDATPKPKTSVDPPTWRKPSPTKPDDATR